MRKFTTSPFGEEVDLDNPETYKHLPNTIRELDDLMFKEIGQALVYMNHLHKDVYDVDKSGQKARVNDLVSNFADNRSEKFGDIMWFKEQVFIFQDEIENMC